MQRKDLLCGPIGGPRGERSNPKANSNWFPRVESQYATGLELIHAFSSYLPLYRVTHYRTTLRISAEFIAFSFFVLPSHLQLTEQLLL